MANSYDIGDVARISTATVFTDIDGEPFDPATVTFRWRKKGQSPAQALDAGQVKVYPGDDEIVHDGVGDYHIDIALDAPGEWYYRVEGKTANGSPMGADEGRLSVNGSGV